MPIICVSLIYLFSSGLQSSHNFMNILSSEDSSVCLTLIILASLSTGRCLSVIFMG